jgi:hypothetical protein
VRMNAPAASWCISPDWVSSCAGLNDKALIAA